MACQAEFDGAMGVSPVFDGPKWGVRPVLAATTGVSHVPEPVRNRKELALEFISVGTAISLTEWSESTFRRRIAEGSVRRKLEPGVNGRSMVDVDSIQPHICIPLDEDDIALVKSADAGDPEAQTDLALLFLAADKTKSAMYWLELAAKKDYANAMYYMSLCHIDGKGVPQDENLGLMWLSRAAVHGSVIAQDYMKALRDKLAG